MSKFVIALVFFVGWWTDTPKPSGEAGEAPFKQVYAKEDITIHERPMTNKFGEQVREVKVLFTARSSEANVVKMLKDAGLGVKWNLGAGAYEVHDDRKESWVTYIAYDLPWPLNDHDAVLRHSLVSNGGITEVLLESVDDIIPPKKGVERMEQVAGKWTIRHIEGGVVEISYQVSTKPSPIPRLITDPIVHYQMVKSMSALRSLLQGENI